MEGQGFDDIVLYRFCDLHYKRRGTLEARVLEWWHLHQNLKDKYNRLKINGRAFQMMEGTWETSRGWQQVCTQNREVTLTCLLHT